MTERDHIESAAQMRLRHGSPAEQAELAARAARDPALHSDLAAWDRQDAALRALYDPVAQEPVPAALQAVLQRAERRAEHRSGLPVWSQLIAACLLLAVGATGGALGARWAGRAETPLAMAAFRAFATYSVETVHPVEVAATQEPHLSTWLSNRLGRQIAPPDLSRSGFSLMGGRVLPDINGPAVLMMYRDAQGRRLTLYVAPEPGRGEQPPEFAQRDTARSYWWFDDSLGCAVVGDLTREVLHGVAMEAYQQITGA